MAVDEKMAVDTGDLLAWALEQSVGAIDVLDASSAVDIDANGRLAIFVDLTLSDPPAGTDGWPIDDVMALHRRFDDKARELGLETWHVRLAPETDDATDEE